MAPPITNAVPNNSAVTGSGTGAGPGSLGGGGLLKACSGSFFGQPQVNMAAIKGSARIQRFGSTLDGCLDLVQWKSEIKRWFMFLIDTPSC